MVEWVVSASILILVIIALRYVLKGKLSLRLQYALWALVLLRLLVPVSFGSAEMSVMNAVPETVKGQERPIYVWYRGDLGPARPEPDMAGETVPPVPAGPKTYLAPYTGSVPANTTGIALERVLRVLWLSGAAVLGLVFLACNLRLSARLKRSRRPLPFPGCRLPVYLSNAVETPCLFGLFRPAVYVTDEAAEDETRLGHVIAHETTHFLHGDHIWSLLRGACLALHWYNPLVWWAATLSRRDGELACDEATLRRIGEDQRAEYGRTLIGLTCVKRPALLVTATTMTGSKSGIRERITLIAKKPRMAAYTLVAVALIAAAAAGCTFTGAKEGEGPWRWAQTLRGEEVSAVIPWTAVPGGAGSELPPLDAEETDTLLRWLNDLRRGHFKENTALEGGTPAYGLRIETDAGTFHLNESIAPGGALEMNYDGKQWWIDSDELSHFVAYCASGVRGGFVPDAVTLSRPLSSDFPYKAVSDPETVQYLWELYQGFRFDGTAETIEKENVWSIAVTFSDSKTGKSESFNIHRGGLCTLGEDYETYHVLTGGAAIYDDVLRCYERARSSAEVSVESEADAPAAVLDYAKEYVKQKISFYHTTWAETEDAREPCRVTAAKITGLTPISTGTAARERSLTMYRLEYRLLVKGNSDGILAGGMEMDAGWLTERDSLGQPYLLLSCDGNGEWTRICVTSTEGIGAYSVPEMLERYGDVYTAAAMELYQAYLSSSAPLTIVGSGGGEIVPRLHLAYARTWTEQGWLHGDGTPIAAFLEENAAALPAVQMSRDFSVRFAEGIAFRAGLRVYDADFRPVEKTEYYDGLTAVNWLEPGTYFCVYGICGPQGAYIAAGDGYEETGYDCAFRLEVGESPRKFAPAEMHDITSAALFRGGQRSTLASGEALARLEGWLAGATALDYGADCPFGAALWLTRGDGAEFLVCPAEDSCDVVFSDGVYYKLNLPDNAALWALFGEPEQLIVELLNSDGAYAEGAVWELARCLTDVAPAATLEALGTRPAGIADGLCWMLGYALKAPQMQGLADGLPETGLSAAAAAARDKIRYYAAGDYPPPPQWRQVYMSFWTEELPEIMDGAEIDGVGLLDRDGDGVAELAVLQPDGGAVLYFTDGESVYHNLGSTYRTAELDFSGAVLSRAAGDTLDEMRVLALLNSWRPGAGTDRGQ